MLSQGIPQGPGPEGGEGLAGWSGEPAGSGGLAGHLIPKTFIVARCDREGADVQRMTQFLGTFTGKLDRKGRVSVPSQFRAKLEGLGSLDIVLRPSHRDPSVEVWPAPFYLEMTSGLERMDQFSDPLEDLSFGMYSSVFETRPDGDGRLVLPDDLIAHASLVEAVSFAGLGRSFQIWEPAALARRKTEAQQRIRERGLTIPSTVPGQVGRA